MTPKSSMLVLHLVSQRKGTGTLWAKMDDVFPECGLLIKDATRMEQLQCFIDSCHVGANCMERLARRIKVLFDAFPKTELIYLYYRRRSDGLLRAGLFWSDFREPRLISMNRGAWERLKHHGQVFQFTPPDGFYGLVSGHVQAPISAGLPIL